MSVRNVACLVGVGCVAGRCSQAANVEPLDGFWKQPHVQAICSWWKLNVTFRREVDHIEWLASQCGVPLQLVQFPSAQAAFSYLIDAARCAGMPVAVSAIGAYMWKGGLQQAMLT